MEVPTTVAAANEKDVSQSFTSYLKPLNNNASVSE